MRHSLRLIAIGIWLAPAVIQAFEVSSSFQFVSIRKRPPAPCPPLELCIGNTAPSRDPATMNVLPGGRFEARNQTIENLARVAFGFDQVDPSLGVVAETKYSSPLADRFDVTAVNDGEWSAPPGGSSVPGELRMMLRVLLEQRFKLKARVENRKIDVFALELVDPARGPGPELRRASSDCIGPSTDPAAGGTRPPCPLRVERFRVEARDITLTDLGSLLYRADRSRLDRLVVDHTGLEGRFDVRLTLDTLRGESGQPSTAASAQSLAPRQPGPAIDQYQFLRLTRALDQQLGLKLVKTKLPAPTLVIDHAETPVD